jgi:hypothetical protein
MPVLSLEFFGLLSGFVLQTSLNADEPDSACRPSINSPQMGAQQTSITIGYVLPLV